jgi:hypothetical protein
MRWIDCVEDLKNSPNYKLEEKGAGKGPVGRDLEAIKARNRLQHHPR